MTSLKAITIQSSSKSNKLQRLPYLLTLILSVVTDCIIEVVVDYITDAPFCLMPPQPPGN